MWLCLLAAPSIVAKLGTEDLAHGTFHSGVCTRGYGRTSLLILNRAPHFRNPETGEFWVVGPAVLTAATPGFDGEHHGWEVNPTDPCRGDAPCQGLDARVPQFDASRVPDLPVLLEANTSVLKVQSVTWDLCGDPASGGNHQSCVWAATVLTVLSSPPTGQSFPVFRPAYFGNSSTAAQRFSVVMRTTDDLALGRLPLGSLPVPASLESKWVPELPTLASHFLPPHLDHISPWWGGYVHPRAYMPNYGGDIVMNVGDALLRLLTDAGVNDTLAMRRAVAASLTQYGLDLYAMAQGGTMWPAGGGWDSGRKLPIALAGLLLRDTSILNFLASPPFNTFAEDGYLNSIAPCLGKRTHQATPLFGGVGWPIETEPCHNSRFPATSLLLLVLFWSE
eukprot:gene7436-1330_t